MEIEKIKVIREVSRTTCKKCGKIINGTSEIMLKHNLGLHKKYCKGVKNEKIQDSKNLKGGKK